MWKASMGYYVSVGGRLAGGVVLETQACRSDNQGHDAYTVTITGFANPNCPPVHDHVSQNLPYWVYHMKLGCSRTVAPGGRTGRSTDDEELGRAEIASKC